MASKTHEKLLKKAENHIFSTGINDGSAHFARANMCFGLAKMHFVQDKYGLKSDATFISSPDECVTRNINRWEQGVGYGGKISWGNGSQKLMILDVKPNACGMLLGGVDEIPDPEELVKKTKHVIEEDDYIDNVRVNWDFGKSNHFIEVYQVENLSRKPLPKYAVIVHAGCPELKSDYLGKPGLYFNQSKILSQICDRVKTPFGTCHVLEGNSAYEYFKSFKFADSFAEKRRELAFCKLFDASSKDIIANHSHQGLLNVNEVRLGCHYINNERDLFPVSLKADCPSYIMSGCFNFSKDQIDRLGFDDRAVDLGVYRRLRNANLLPHGGGYKLSNSLYIKKVFEIEGKRYFEINMASGMGNQIVSNPHELEYSYRGREIMLKAIELGLGRIVAKMTPVYDIKI